MSNSVVSLLHYWTFFKINQFRAGANTTFSGTSASNLSCEFRTLHSYGFLTLWQTSSFITHALSPHKKTSNNDRSQKTNLSFSAKWKKLVLRGEGGLTQFYAGSNLAWKCKCFSESWKKFQHYSHNYNLLIVHGTKRQKVRGERITLRNGCRFSQCVKTCLSLTLKKSKSVSVHKWAGNWRKTPRRSHNSCFLSWIQS